MEEFYYMTLPTVISTIALCVIMQNKFPEVFDNDNEKYRLKISVDIYDPIQGFMLLMMIIFLLFTPVVNLIFSFVYSISIITQVIKHTKGGK